MWERVNLYFKKVKNLFTTGSVISNRGYCTTCENKTLFIEENTWLRDNYRCKICRSIPRQRAIIHVLNLYFPKWSDLIIHESSPGGSSSKLLEKKCQNYSASHFYDDIQRGEMKGKIRSEDLSNLTFQDESIDLFITQDVFEHVMEPSKAFWEIARVLKTGGAHVFTMPWYPRLEKSRQRAEMHGDKIKYLEKPIYHGNPINSKGSLVTYDWGMDFIDFINGSCGLKTEIINIKNRYLGLDAKFLEVFISRKI